MKIIISKEAADLLSEIIENEENSGYWAMRFQGLSRRDDAILRGCFKELKDNNLIAVNWADNIPYIITILKDGYLYEGQLNTPKGDEGMKDYEVLLKKLIPMADKNNYYVMLYTMQEGERPLIIKLEQEGLIQNVNYCGKNGVGVDLTYDGYHYFDEDETAEIKPIVVYQNAKMYDVFLSHASADKIPYVEGLKKTLELLGVSVFYDKDTIKWGDRWKDKIYEGLEQSEFAIIVISKNFFGREWTEEELNRLLNRQNSSGQKIILPIIHEITTEELAKKYPDIADIQVISTNKYTNEMIAILFAEQLIKRQKSFLKGE